MHILAPQRMKELLLASLAIVATSFISTTSAQESLAASEESPATNELDLGRIAKMTSNPLGAAWMMWFQNDHVMLDGTDVSGQRHFNSTLLQPVMSFPFELDGGDWNLSLRPVLQYVSAPYNSSAAHLFGKTQNEIFTNTQLLDAALNPYDGRTSGMGDTALLAMAGPAREDGFIWGAGLTQIFPTAENDLLGQEKWQAGPAFFAGRLAPNPGGWNYGALIQHWWSYAGDEDRDDTSKTDIQYLLNYRLSQTEMIGMTPNITYNWKAEPGERLALPIGLGYTNVVRVGRLPIRMAIELQRYLEQPDSLGPVWNLRLMFIPILPNPFSIYP